MFQTLVNAWKIADLRRKLLFTFFILVVFRIGAHIPVPGVDPAAMERIIAEGTILGFFDIISGGAFKNLSIFAMGIMPYITASIIMELLTIAVPSLERLAKEGEEGRKKIVQYTRYGTVVLGFIQAVAMALFLARQPEQIIAHQGVGSYLDIALSLTAGTTLLMWMGELITEKGIGNGISLLIFAGIVARLPAELYGVYEYVYTGTVGILSVAFFIVVALIIIGGIIAVQEGQRRIPVQYAKRVVGRRIYGGQSTHIPLKVNQAGVIPIIFAMSILLFPSTVASWFPQNNFARSVVNFLQFSSLPYMITYALLIIFFTYFYTAVVFNPQDVAENMKKYGGFIPGLRPGKPTADYIERILIRITFVGAVFLAFIAILPNIVTALTGLNVYFGGTSLLIVVGVALETMKQIEAQLLMRSYRGFIK